MRCCRCDNEYPSKYYFSTPNLCTGCFDALPIHEREEVEKKAKYYQQSLRGGNAKLDDSRETGAIIRGDNVSVYSDMSLYSSIIDDLGEGDTVEVIARIRRRGSEWFSIRYSGERHGYILSDTFITPVIEGFLRQKLVKIYEHPTSTSAELAQLSKGDVFILESDDGGIKNDEGEWIYVRDEKGISGYINAAVDAEFSSLPSRQSNGIIPPAGYDRNWFNGGVLIGGIVIGWMIAIEEIPFLISLVGGLASAIAFILFFDRQGVWRFWRVVPAIALMGMAAIIVGIPLVGGLLGFIVFLIVGYVSVGVGRIFDREWKSTPTATSLDRSLLHFVKKYKKLPGLILCPACGEELELSTDERQAFMFSCPQCKELVDMSHAKLKAGELPVASVANA